MTGAKTDCRFYRGSVPCPVHKRTGVKCGECGSYEPLGESVLIIKLGAIGDVIRTTPLLRRIKRQFPSGELSWLSYTPEVIPGSWVDNILDFSLQNIIWLQNRSFDWLINLDKDREAIALAASISAKKKSGFGMDGFGKCQPISSGPEFHKWLTGIWDDENKINRKSYLEEVFDICGYRFGGEEYVFECENLEGDPETGEGKNAIGLNTGCGARWLTRLWPEDHWTRLAERLIERGHDVVVLGGRDEDEKNRRIAHRTGARYFGVMPLSGFFKVMSGCDVIVTQVTMAMHVAIGLKKEVVLLNNIFNSREFELYGRGEILEPPIECTGCFKQKYDERCRSGNCMEMIAVEGVLDAVSRRLKNRSS